MAEARPAEPRLTLEQYEQIKPTAHLDIAGKPLVFHIPNSHTRWRVQSLRTKEPATIAWLDAIAPDEVLFDVGANIGIYTIYAAVVRGARVFAFEPEGQNFALLNANIHANGVDGRVVAYPVALADAVKLDILYLSALETGQSAHSFGAEVGYDLEPRPAAFRQGAISITLDEAVESGATAMPSHIKIDVDGFEHRVLAGAERILANPALKSLLVELNFGLAEHREAAERLVSAGFAFDPDQLAAARRPSGPFEGTAEVIFTRRNPSTRNIPGSAERRLAASRAAQDAAELAHAFTLRLPSRDEERSVLRHVLAELDAAPIRRDPFPHVIVDGIFPDDYYRRILESFPAVDCFTPISETGRVTAGDYNDRAVILFEHADLQRLPPAIRGFWTGFASWLYSDLFIAGFTNKFAADLDYRLDRICVDGTPLRVRSDASLVLDRTNYSIGPHTDAPHRLVSFLFYMPADAVLAGLGTSFYRPKDKDFTCWGERHHEFDQFVRTETVAFLPNRLVAFPKTERTFHGVEPIERPNVERKLLINNIRILNSVTH